jgi:uncharacterized protein YlzI (FlbEa/FlbD family)
MPDSTILYDEGLKELVKELRENVANGKIKYKDAMDVLTKAIKKLFEEKGQVIKEDQNNN